jgi:hypothetical protein
MSLFILFSPGQQICSFYYQRQCPFAESQVANTSLHIPLGKCWKGKKRFFDDNVLMFVDFFKFNYVAMIPT